MDLREKALSYLARREHSRAELQAKLLSKGYDEDLVAAVLDELITEGLLSDLRFTESFIRCRTGRGYGPLKIKQELQVKGISRDLLSQLLNTNASSWVEVAREVWRKKFTGVIPEDYAERAKQMRFLQSRGFTQEQINTVLHAD